MTALSDDETRTEIHFEEICQHCNGAIDERRFNSPEKCCQHCRGCGSVPNANGNRLLRFLENNHREVHRRLDTTTVMEDAAPQIFRAYEVEFVDYNAT